MPRPVLALLLTTMCWSSAALAQTQPPPGQSAEKTSKPAMPQAAAPQNQPPAGTPLPGQVPVAGQTPPVAPRTQDTPVPPPIVVPPPPAGTVPSDVPVRPITAEEAARIALRLQPNVAIARYNIAAQQGRTDQVRSGLLPQVTLLGSYTHIETLSQEGSGVVGPVGTGTGGTGTTSGGTTGTGSTGTGTSTGGTGTSTGGTGSTGTSGSTGTGTSGNGGTGTNTGTSSSGGVTTVTQLGASSVATGEGTVGQATLRQLIYDFNHTLDLVRQSRALERAAVQNLTRVQYDLVLQVKQAYYQLTENTQLVRVNEDNLANRQAQLDLTTARLNSGLGLPQDVVTAQTAKAEAVQALNVARGLEGIARQQLAFIMGIDPRTPLQPSDTGELPVASNDVNALVQTALQRRPEILQAQALIDSARYGVNAARTTNAPVISGNINLTSRGTDFPPGGDTFSVGAAIQFSPFDGGLTRGRVKEARANLDTAQAQLMSAQLTVSTDVTQAYLNLRTAEQRVAAANSEVFNAEEGVRIATGRYRSGLGLFLDIINAQAFLLSARTNVVTTQSLVEQNRAALNRALGSPLTTR
jgi:outer membrane protein